MFQNTRILDITLLSTLSVLPSQGVDSAPFPIWEQGVMLAKAEKLTEISNAEFHVIKKWDKKSDGYTSVSYTHLTLPTT